MDKKKSIYHTLKTMLLASSVLLAGPSLVRGQATHTVQSGEYLLAIANAYGVSVSELMAVNGLSSDYILPGMQLSIPGASGEASGNVTSSQSFTPEGEVTSYIYTVQAGDTLYNIAAAFGITADQLASYNNVSSWIDVGTQLVIPDASYTPTSSVSSPTSSSADSGNWGVKHTVSSGEILSSIAAAYGTTVDAIMAHNGLTSTWLNVGDVLYMPNGPVYTPQSYTYTEAESTPIPASGTVHTVQAGDTLYDLAIVYGSTVSDIMTWNGLTSDYLDVGMNLVVSPAGPVADDVVTTAETSEGERIERDLSQLPEQARPQTHVVEPGENIWRIANQYSISAESLKVWNNLKSDTLEIGQELYVSNPAFIPTIHIVKAEESLEDIAKTYHTTENYVRQWNDLTEDEALTLEEGRQLIVSDPQPKLHEVKPNESLQQIAEEYKITVDELREWNKIPSQSEIVNGTLIVSNPTGVQSEASE